MLLGVDHLVIGVGDLGAAIRDYAALGFSVVPGGRHANGVMGLAGVTVAATDVREARGWYEAVLGRPGETLRNDDLDADGVRFTVGPHMLEFLQPRHGRGPIGTWVDSRGPGPYAARFTGGAPGAALDPRLSHGARLSVG